MKKKVAVIFIITILCLCALTLGQKQKTIQETQTADVWIVTSTLSDSATPLTTDTVTPYLTFTDTPLPTYTSIHLPTETTIPSQTDVTTPLPTDSPAVMNTPTYVAKGYPCAHYFTIKVLEPPTFVSVLEGKTTDYPFNGTFMIVKLRFINHTDRPRWVWYSDYYMHGIVNGKPVLYQLKGADDPSHALEKIYKANTFQVNIPALTTYDTMVAFDVNPAGENWNLTVMPDQLCKVTIPLENN